MRRLLPLFLSLGGCVGGVPPACFSDDECDAGSRCVERACRSATAADARASDTAVPDARPDGEPPPVDARPLADGPAFDLAAPVPDLAPAPDLGSPDAEESTPDAGAPEPCNGFDDDGDGVIDEGNRLGLACVSGTGECIRGGHYVCGAGSVAVCDAAPGAPAPEICDGNDNDCDGEIDEDEPDRSCYPPAADPATVGHGLCASGHELCGPIGQAPLCVGAVTPAREQCDGLDNDCDDRIDEDFGVGDDCEFIVGDCVLLGRVACGEDGLSTRCDAGAPPPETCNELDDDCDGEVDEGIMEACYDAEPATDGVGVCRAGLRTCKGGAFLACLGQVVPSPEIPGNGLDEDCDGELDEI